MMRADPERVVQAWMDAVLGRCWQLRASPDDLPQLQVRGGNALRALCVALEGASDIALGGPDYREPVQLFSFLAGWMAGNNLPISAACALSHGLRDIVGGEPHPVFDHLVVVLTEAYAVGQSESAQARHRTIIEKSQVVCALGESLVALFLVGDPDNEALDDATGRLMMLAVMRDARTVFVDVSALLNADRVLATAVRFLAQHPQALANREIAITGATTAQLSALGCPLPEAFSSFESLEMGLSSVWARP